MSPPGERRVDDAVRMFKSVWNYYPRPPNRSCPTPGVEVPSTTSRSWVGFTSRVKVSTLLNGLFPSVTLRAVTESGLGVSDEGLNRRQGSDPGPG